MSVYKTIIRPVVTYGSETWMMNIANEEKLKIFERKYWEVDMDQSKIQTMNEE